LRLVVDSKKRFFLMVLGTAASGLALAVLAALAGSALLSDSVAGWGGLVGGLAGMVIGYPLGVMAGVAFTRFILKCPGSLWLGLLGAVLPFVLTMGLAEPLNLNQNPNVLFASFFLAAPFMAAAGFHIRTGRAKRA